MKRIDLKHRQVVWKQHGFKNLLIWLLAYLLLGPFLGHLPYAGEIAGLLLTLVLFSAVYAVNRQSVLLSVSIFLLLTNLAILWLARWGVLAIPPIAASTLLAIYLGTLAYSFLRHLLSVRRVNGNVICAALCLYLVIGLFWGALYQLLVTLEPGSLAGGLLDLDLAKDRLVREHTLAYFSFVTLSTLGYGDITPQTPAAATLCQAEAILGQFFTVALIARLVGLQVAQQVEHQKQAEDQD